MLYSYEVDNAICCIFETLVLERFPLAGMTFSSHTRSSATTSSDRSHSPITYRLRLIAFRIGIGDLWFLRYIEILVENRHLTRICQ